MNTAGEEHQEPLLGNDYLEDLPITINDAAVDEEDVALLGLEGGNMTFHPNELFNNVTENAVISDNSSPAKLVFGIPLQSMILLNLVAIIWGTQHAVIKSVVDDNTTIGLFGEVGDGFLAVVNSIDGWMGINLNNRNLEMTSVGAMGGGTAAYFTMARFGLASLLASPYTPGLSSAIEGAKGNFRRRFMRGETNGQEEDLVALATIEHESVNEGSISDTSNSRELTVSTAASTDTSLDNNSHNSINLTWRYGFELGIYMFLGYAFQAIGLQTTTATRSGFILYLNVKLVPFFSFLIFRKSIRIRTWISASVAFGGTALLLMDCAGRDSADAAAADGGSIDGDDAGLGMAFAVGDLWSIAAAAASAMFILRMEAASKAVPKSSELNSASLWIVAILSLFWTMGISWNNLKDVHADAGAEPLLFASASSDSFIQTLHKTFQQTIHIIITHPIPLLYLSGVATALANYLQSKAQKDVTAERAAVIYAMDPVYGAIFANILLGEKLGVWGWVGAGFIVVAATTNAIWDFGGEAEAEGTSS